MIAGNVGISRVSSLDEESSIMCYDHLTLS